MFIIYFTAEMINKKVKHTLVNFIEYTQLESNLGINLASCITCCKGKCGTT